VGNSINTAKLCEYFVHLWLKVNDKQLTKEFFLLSDSDKQFYYKNVLSHAMWWGKSYVFPAIHYGKIKKLEIELRDKTPEGPYTPTNLQKFSWV
jgi:hypothetical protein